MKYYLISKTDKTFKSDDAITTRGGYSFHQKLAITLFHPGMINYILNKKLTNSLKNIINLYLLYQNNEDDDESCVDTLIPRVETLRSILIEKYAAYLSESEIEAYLTKFDKLEAKISTIGNQKSRSM